MNKRIISLFLVFTFLFVNLSSPVVFAEETPTTGYIQIRSGDTIDYYTTIKSGESLYLSAEDIAVVSGYVFEPSENEDYLGSYSKPGETDVLTEVLITPDGKVQTMGKEYQLPLIHQGDQVYFSIPEMLYLLHAQWCVEEGKLIVQPLPDTIIDFMTENFVKIVENKVNQVDLLVNGESEMAHYLRTTLAAVFNDFDPTIFIFWWPGENVVPVLDQEYEEALLQIAVDDEAFLDSYGLQEITKLVEGSEFSQAKSDWSSAVGIYKFIEELENASENTDEIVDKMSEATETQKSLKFDAFGDVSGLTSKQIDECSKALDGISDALEITTLIADAVEVSQRSQKWGKDYIEQIRILTDFDDTGYNKIVTDRVKTVASGLVQEYENPINAAAEKAHLEAVSLLVSKFADETFLGKFISIFNVGLAMAKTDENIQDSLDAADLAYMVDCLFKTEHIAVEEMERSYHRLNGNTVTGDFTQDDLKRLRNSVMLSLRTNLRNRAFIYYLNVKLNDNQFWEASDEAEAIRQKIANDYAMICQLMETEGSDRLILLDDFENMYSDEYGEVRQPVSTDIFHEGEMPSVNIWEELPQKFYYSMGIGNWSTTITILDDGTFTGQYYDLNMGEFGNEYPDGTIYICNFKGKFSMPKQINEYIYSTKLENFNIEGTPGEEYYEDNQRYVTCETPIGFINADEFLIYLPGCPINSISEEFLLLPPVNKDEQVLSSGCYGIDNIKGKTGFVGFKDTVELSRKEQYNINIFLSNFSEQNFQNYDRNNLDEAQLLNFAYIHYLINNKSELKTTDEGNVLLTTEEINSKLNRYLGLSITPKNKETVYQYGDEKIYYKDGSFKFRLGVDESHGYMTVVDSLEKQSDQTYLATFKIYSVDKYNTGGDHIRDTSYYYFTPSEAESNSDLTYQGAGTAVIQSFEENGTTSYQLIKYTLN